MGDSAALGSCRAVEENSVANGAWLALGWGCVLLLCLKLLVLQAREPVACYWIFSVFSQFFTGKGTSVHHRPKGMRMGYLVHATRGTGQGSGEPGFIIEKRETREEKRREEKRNTLHYEFHFLCFSAIILMFQKWPIVDFDYEFGSWIDLHPFLNFVWILYYWASLYLS